MYVDDDSILGLKQWQYRFQLGQSLGVYEKEAIKSDIDIILDLGEKLIGRKIRVKVGEATTGAPNPQRDFEHLRSILAEKDGDSVVGLSAATGQKGSDNIGPLIHRFVGDFSFALTDRNASGPMSRVLGNEIFASDRPGGNTVTNIRSDANKLIPPNFTFNLGPLRSPQKRPN